MGGVHRPESSRDRHLSNGTPGPTPWTMAVRIGRLGGGPLAFSRNRSARFSTQGGSAGTVRHGADNPAFAGEGASRPGGVVGPGPGPPGARPERVLPAGP